MDTIITKLEKLPKDIRDLSHHALYGTISPSAIPTQSFMVSPLPPIILNQIDLDFCTGESSSALNTQFQISNYSLVNYLGKIGMPTSLSYRSSLAVNYGLVNSTEDYMQLASLGKNGSINLEILSNLIYENGDYFDPLYQFSKIKQMRGEWQSYGANLRDAANALVTYGSLPKRLSPFTYEEGKSTDQTRDFLANWNNWNPSLDTIAKQYQLGSYLSVDGPYDAFDNICSVLYTNFSQNMPFGVLFGLNWRDEWTSMPGGVINENYASSSGEGHAIYLMGIAFINGIPYVVAQNSWGKNVGAEGLYYLPRNVINTEFATNYGAFTFKQLSYSVLKSYNKTGIMVGDSFITKSKKIISNFFKNI